LLSCQVRPDMPIQSKHPARVRCHCISSIAHDLMTSRSYCQVLFASYAGLTLIICGVFNALPDRYKALNRANRLACVHLSISFLMQILLISLRNRTEQYLAQRAQPKTHSSDNQGSNRLPLHILNAMYPTDIDDTKQAPPTERKKYGSSLIGQSIHLRDQ
jgi:hypothetical protein